MKKFAFEEMRNLNKKATLDCETPESALHSVSNILGLTCTDLIGFIKRFDLDDYIEKRGLAEDRPADIVLKSLLTQMDCSWGFSHTAWFHMTRCLPTQKFEQGLKPLLSIIDDIWELLFEINPSTIARPKWDEYRKLLETDRSASHLGYYHHRINTPGEQGPDGILVNELRSGGVGGICTQDHYLKEAPEIVICICKYFGGNLLDEYTKATKPYIVKFETTDCKLDHLSTALYYVYERQHSEPQFNNTYNADYRGGGISIQADQIRKVIPVENT